MKTGRKKLLSRVLVLALVMALTLGTPHSSTHFLFLIFFLL